MPRSCLERSDDQSLDVVDNAVEGWALPSISSKRVLPSSLSLNWTTAKLGCPHLARETSTRFVRLSGFTADTYSRSKALNEQSLLFKGIFEGKHTNPWELENLISFLRRVRRARIQARRLLHIPVNSGTDRTIDPRNHFPCFENWGSWCLADAIALRLVWVTAWASLADHLLRNKLIETWYASLPKRPPQPTAVCSSAHALSELSLFRKPLPTAVTTEKTGA